MVILTESHPFEPNRTVFTTTFCALRCREVIDISSPVTIRGSILFSSDSQMEIRSMRFFCVSIRVAYLLEMPSNGNITDIQLKGDGTAAIMALYLDNFLGFIDFFDAL